MNPKWHEWLKEYSLPEGIHYYNFNGDIIFKIGHSYHVALISPSGLLGGFGLYFDDDLESVKRKIANAVLRLQINEASPRKYDNFVIDGKNHIIAPE